MASVTKIHIQSPISKESVRRGIDSMEVMVAVPHGDTRQAVIERCPACGFAYADGGYCEECGWFRPRKDCPHCNKKGTK